MRHIRFSIVAALACTAVLSSCAKIAGEGKRTLNGQEEVSFVGVSVGAEVARTKAGDGTDKISSIRVYVYNDEGFFTIGESITGQSVELTLPSNRTGINYSFWVVANGYDFASGKWKYAHSASPSLSELQGSVLDLSGVGAADIPMIGNVSSRITLESTGVDVTVSRLAAKVSLREVGVSFTNETYMGHNLKLRRIYITNAVSSETLEGKTPAAFSYYNEDRLVKGAADGVLLVELTSPHILNVGVTKEVKPYVRTHDFYLFTNSTPKQSRLVLECLYNETEVWYYGADLGELGAGREYVITKANILGQGSSDPSRDPDRTSFSLGVEVAPWGEGWNRDFDI